MGIAWSLVSGLAVIKPTSEIFGVPRRRTLSELLGALMLVIGSPEPSAHSPPHHRPHSSERWQEHWAVFAATLGLRLARLCHSLTAVRPQVISRSPWASNPSLDEKIRQSGALKKKIFKSCF